MKRNIIIFPGNFLPNIGGLETHVDELVKYLSKRGHKITIFTPNTSNAKAMEVIHTNVKVIRYPAFFLISNFPFPKFWSFKFWSLTLSLYKENYDIVMTRTRFFMNSWLGFKFAKFRLKRIKLIHVEHGSSHVMLDSNIKNSFALIWDKTLGRIIINYSDSTVAISNAVLLFLKKEFRKNRKYPLITRGVDFELYNSTKKDDELERKFKGKLKLTYLGRLFKWKGVEESIKAYRLLPKNVKNKSVLIIAGDGEDYEKLIKTAGNDYNNGIYFLGSVSFKRGINILNSTDLYLHSAYPGGGLSNSLLQAMITKCAIIASPNEGAKDVINTSNGILLKTNKAEEIKNSMIKLVKNKSLRTKLSKKAYIDVKEKFDWKDRIEAYEKVFNEVLKN